MDVALASCFLAVSVLSNTAIAQDIPADLKPSVQARNGAVRAGDDQTWVRYTTDDFLAIDETGRATKAQRIAEIKGLR